VTSLSVFFIIAFVAVVYDLLSKKKRLHTLSQFTALHFITSNFDVVNETMTKYMLIASLLVCSVSATLIQVKNEDHYFLTGKSQNLIFLGKYNDLFIEKPFDKKTRKLSDSLILVKTSDNVNQVFLDKKVGLLHW